VRLHAETKNCICFVETKHCGSRRAFGPAANFYGTDPHLFGDVVSCNTARASPSWWDICPIYPRVCFVTYRVLIPVELKKLSNNTTGVRQVPGIMGQIPEKVGQIPTKMGRPLASRRMCRPLDSRKDGDFPQK
jgi:hypothetical protein